jgi:hypothetical protein
MYMKKLLLPLLTIFSAYAAPEPSLSVDEIIRVVWTMNHNDTCELYKAVFPEATVERKKEANYLDRVFDTIDKAFDKAGDAMDKAWRTIARSIFGKTLKERILETYFSTSPQEQEMIKNAVQGSHDEFYQLTPAERIIGIIIPFGIFVIMWDNMKKVEEKRTALRKQA